MISIRPNIQRRGSARTKLVSDPVMAVVVLLARLETPVPVREVELALIEKF